ncbi:stage II sporulation protein D [Falsibacillus albus]|uniref:Stage II sporulation protein D n=1 Tax=Falsibacillus albus TaxID=2478915 RepID=A0A3L7JYH9_9BACI|nr:stage II sporulation protein D [Falsibacillus albus]RLQ94751.1 stage II sporulation protein D [Falsibacillus albus]
MKQNKFILLIVAVLLVLTFAVPSLLVLPFSDGNANGKLDERLSLKSKKADNSWMTKGPAVAVFRSEQKKVEKLPIEEYVIGVVASEMSAEFDEEALKAQALAARTYIISHLMNKDSGGVPDGADVTDTVQHQVYKNLDDLKRIWGSDYDWKLKKVTSAVKATAGQIITYKDEPINAAFFSTSNGYTENSQDYWENTVPYLQSVASPWDKESPKYTAQKTISISDFEKELGVKLGNSGSVGTITSRTPGKRVGTIEIGGKKFTGREVREKLALNSSDFSWVRKGDHLIITTKGYGHGVGMSQYGADGMAKQGKNYKQILAYYYKGIQITSDDKYVTKVTASK